MPGRDRARRTRASAATAGRSASPGRAVTRGRRARQAPVPALRGRPGDPLAPAHDRLVAGARRRPRRVAARAPGSCCRRGEREVAAVRRPGARADDRRRARASTSASPALGPDILAAELDEARVPAPPARGRPDAPDRRRAARPAHDRRDREPVEGRGLLRGRIDPWRPAGDVSDEEALAIVHDVAPADAAVRRSTATRTATGGSTARAGRPCPRCGDADPRARPGRRQPPDLLVPGVPDVTLRRVGHKGADHIAPGNTLATFDAALAHGVDMIEFDVLPEDRDAPGDEPAAARARLRARPPRRAHARGGARPPRRARRSRGVELDVDLKLPGYEQRVVEALRAHGLVERSLISTLYMRSLVVLRELEPAAAARLVGPARARATTRASKLTPLPALALLPTVARGGCPASPPAHIARGPLRRGDGPLAARHAAALRAVREAGGELYVWTVDDARADPRARGARRHRRDHQRPAAVRRRLGDLAACAALKSRRVGARGASGGPASVIARALRDDLAAARATGS